MTKGKKAIIGALALAGVVGGGVYGAYAYQGDYTKHDPNYSEERHSIMVNAFENNDYEAWKTQMEENMKSRGGRGGRVLEVINEDNFAKFAEAYKLATAGDVAGADAIRAELGLRTSNGDRVGAGYGRRGDGTGKGQGMNRGQNAGGNFVDANGDGVCDNLNQN